VAKLVVSTGGAVVFQRFVDAERLTIGRERTNDVVIDDPSVSREHAVISSVGNDHIIEDLDSSNGTLVNGVAMPRRILQHGDVVAFGSYHLRYLNPKVAADVDLERTMYIPGLSQREASDPATPNPIEGELPLPARATPRTNFPRGSAWMMAGPRAGEVLELDAVVALFGKPTEQSAVVTRRPRGYYVTHVSGRRYPRVNGHTIGREPLLLKHGDVVDVGSEKLEFSLDELDRQKAAQRRRP
jgi:pSer/pThr/pTyr-binding forkhead associated (FHA) protein